MGWREALFGPSYDPDSIPSGPVVAIAGSFATFPPGPVVRFWYSPDPRHAENLPAVHETMIRAYQDAPFHHRLAQTEFHRRGGYSMQVPQRFAGSVPVWLRDVYAPAFPPDLLDRLPPTPFWLRFDSPRTVRFDVVPGATEGTRARQRIERVRKRRGVAVRAAVVQANRALFAPGPDDDPGLVVFGFDERIGDDELRAIAAKVGSYKNTTPREPELVRVAEMTTDEVFVYYHRDLLPRVVAGRRELYVADLMFHRPFLRHRYLVGEVLDCLAEPGDRGMLELLPFNPNM